MSVNNTTGTNPASNSKKPKQVSVFSGVGDFFKRLKFQYILIGLGVITAIYLFASIYFGFLSFSIHNAGLRISIVILLVLWSVPMLLKFSKQKETANRARTAFKQVKIGWKIPTLIAIILAVVFLCLALFTTPLFLAKDYRDIISNDISTYTSEEFNSDHVQNYDEMKVAVVDKAIAERKGDKKLGDGNYGSQYDVGQYTMQYYKDNIYWVAPLEYKGFFQWASESGKDGGSPGYIMVNATDDNAEVQLINTKIKYLPSGYFGHDAERKIYFSSMGKLRDDRISFEIDDNGVPHFIQATIEKKFAATSGTVTTGLLALNAITGKVEYYNYDNKPDWIDHVYPTEVIIDQLGYWGRYTHGFWNTVFTKKEVNSVTQGYNYCYNINKEGKGSFYLTTGLTSAASDESLVGLIMANLRERSVDFYQVTGATELAAMRSAEGKVQAYKYVASFPTLVNFNSDPTYFMVLKDNTGLVKSYAYVNVSDFNKVAVADTIADAQKEYMNITGNFGDGTEELHELVIESIASAIIDGDTVYHIIFKSDDPTISSTVYKASIKLNSKLPFAKAGDTISVKFTGSNIVKLEIA